MITSFDRKTVVVPLVVASAANSATPEIALTQKPAHMIGKRRRSGSSGMRGAAPSRRRSITVLAPTRTPRPSVCSVRTVGYPQIDPDSRSHDAKPVASSDASRFIMRTAAVQSISQRHDGDDGSKINGFA